MPDPLWVAGTTLCRRQVTRPPPGHAVGARSRRPFPACGKMMRMTGNPAEHRLYSDLAPWWPLISAPEEYTEEAATAAAILSSAAIGVREVLELGSGGGHN